jgi:hypothetical protein
MKTKPVFMWDEDGDSHPTPRSVCREIAEQLVDHLTNCDAGTVAFGPQEDIHSGRHYCIEVQVFLVNPDTGRRVLRTPKTLS